MYGLYNLTPSCCKKAVLEMFEYGMVCVCACVSECVCAHVSEFLSVWTCVCECFMCE